MPAPVVTRLNTITYAGLALGAATNYQLSGVHVTDGDHERLSIAFDVLVRDTTGPAMRTLAAALEAAFSTPDADLTVNLGGTDFHALAQAANTGMNAAPTWALLNSHRSGRSRTYRCSVAVMLPEDRAGRDGRRSSVLDIATDDVGIRSVALRATYTAQPGTPAVSATEQIAAAFDDYLDDVKADLGGEWEEVSRVVTREDDNDKLATVVVGLQELTFNQAAGTRDHAAIVSPIYDITTFRQALPRLPGSNAVDPVSVTIVFSMGIKISEAQAANPDAFVASTVLPYLRSLVQAHTSVPAAPVAVEQSVSVDVIRSRARGAMTFIAAGSSLLRASLRTLNHGTTGNALVPVMSSDPHERDLHPSPAYRTRRVVLHTLELATAETISPDDLSQRAINEAKRQAVAEGFWLQDENEEWEELERRLEGGADLIRLVERVRVFDFEFARISNGGTSIAGGGGTQFTSQARS